VIRVAVKLKRVDDFVRRLLSVGTEAIQNSYPFQGLEPVPFEDAEADLPDAVECEPVALVVLRQAPRPRSGGNLFNQTDYSRAHRKARRRSTWGATSGETIGWRSLVSA